MTLIYTSIIICKSSQCVGQDGGLIRDLFEQEWYSTFKKIDKYCEICNILFQRQTEKVKSNLGACSS